MELRHLRYFAAVAEHLCFRKAARSLRVSYPSLRGQVMDLEQEVGVQLFNRSRSQVSLTESGHVFLVSSRGPMLTVRSEIGP